jgi:hypothetical protein
MSNVCGVRCGGDGREVFNSESKSLDRGELSVVQIFLQFRIPIRQNKGFREVHTHITAPFNLSDFRCSFCLFLFMFRKFYRTRNVRTFRKSSQMLSLSYCLQRKITTNLRTPRKLLIIRKLRNCPRQSNSMMSRYSYAILEECKSSTVG